MLASKGNVPGSPKSPLRDQTAFGGRFDLGQPREHYSIVFRPSVFCPSGAIGLGSGSLCAAQTNRIVTNGIRPQGGFTISNQDNFLALLHQPLMDKCPNLEFVFHCKHLNWFFGHNHMQRKRKAEKGRWGVL